MTVRPLVVFALGALSGCASAPPEAAGTTSAPVIGGELDPSTESVVVVRREGASEICSGVLVAPRVVLTAGHCTWSSARYFVGFGADGRKPESEREVTRVVPYPTATFGEADLHGGIDLAALELASDAPVAPMPLRASPLPEAMLGAEVAVIGMGRSETSTLDSSPRRRASSTVSRVCSRLLRFGDATTNACDGDSGGAVVWGGALVAIVSFGLGGCNTPSSHTRLDAHRPWVERMIGGRFDEPCPECVAADASCGAPVSPWPEPAREDGGCSVASGPSAAHTVLPPLVLLLTCLARRSSRRKPKAEGARPSTSDLRRR